MLIILHRVNTISKLKKTDISYGVEIDLRSSNNKIILHHDPFKKGIPFTEWIKHYNHKMIVLNVKEEGLEEQIIKILKKNKIKNFFFHDQTFSSMLKNMKNTKVSIRFSEYENICNKEKIFKFVKWVWIDNFTKIPNDKIFYKYLKKKNIKVCLVSPELVLKSRVKEISKIKKYVKKINLNFFAVCTKYPKLWKI